MKAIINSVTKEYFSTYHYPHFTKNKEIANRYITDRQAMESTELLIDGNDGFEMFGMIDTEIVDI